MWSVLVWLDLDCEIICEFIAGMSNNNWEQFQSTLLPPTAFERSSANNSSNLIVDVNDDPNNQALIANTSWTDAGFCSTGRSTGLSESQQLGLLLNEIGKMKEEMRELRSENKSLRDKNRGEWFADDDMIERDLSRKF